MYTQEEIRQLIEEISRRIRNDDPSEMEGVLDALLRLGKEPPGFRPELLVDAHVALATLDHRHLLAAVRLSERHGLAAKQPELLLVARRHGNIRAVYELITARDGRTCPALEMPDFATWFEEHGLFRFDLYHRGGYHFFIEEEDADLIRTIIATMVPSPETFWSRALARMQDKAGPINEIRVALLERLARDQAPIVNDRAGWSRKADEDFPLFCEKEGLALIEQAQVGNEERGGSSSVFVARDADGIFKIFKERLAEPPFCRVHEPIESEEALHARLTGCTGIPRCYGRTDVDASLSLLRLELRYGQRLTDYIDTGKRLSIDDACAVVGRIADILHDAHLRGVAHLDVQPQNIKIDGRDVSLLDLGESRFFPDGQRSGPCRIHNPRYAAPETVRCAEASRESDLFALGVVFAELAYGEHPFMPYGDSHSPSQLRFLAYALGNAHTRFERPPGDEQDPRLALIPRLLARAPEERPSITEVVRQLKPSRTHSIRHSGRIVQVASGTVIVPVRMGVPHDGHIRFLARLLELGYRIDIWLHHAYHLRPADPLHKWDVAKIVAKSLIRRGFDLERVRFRYVPLFATEADRQLYNANMRPEKLVAVASGNPEAWAAFPGLPIIDQRALFGQEGTPYETRSWGERLRKALREDDRTTCADLLADGAEEVFSLSELRRWCLKVEAPRRFVWDGLSGKHVYAIIQEDGSADGPRRKRVSLYGTPEETVLADLPGARWEDRFARDSVLIHDGKRRLLRCEGAELDEDGNHFIHFRLLDA